MKIGLLELALDRDVVNIMFVRWIAGGVSAGSFSSFDDACTGSTWGRISQT